MVPTASGLAETLVARDSSRKSLRDAESTHLFRMLAYGRIFGSVAREGLSEKEVRKGAGNRWPRLGLSSERMESRRWLAEGIAIAAGMGRDVQRTWQNDS